MVDAAEGPQNGVPEEHPLVVPVAQVLYQFAKHLAPQDVRRLAAMCLAEEPELQPVFQDAVNPEMQAKYPRWGHRIVHRDGQAVVLQSIGPKDLGKPYELNDLLSTVHTLAFLTSPIARGVLRAHGFNINFAQVAGQQTSKIIMPGS